MFLADLSLLNKKMTHLEIDAVKFVFSGKEKVTDCSRGMKTIRHNDSNGLRDNRNEKYNFEMNCNKLKFVGILENRMII